MARYTDFYKGQKKKRNYAIVPGVIFLIIFGLVIVLFYSTQKYAVITESGIKIELPLLHGGTISSDESGSAAGDEGSYETSDANIIFEDADYSSVKAVAGAEVAPIRAIYIPYEDLSEENVMIYANRLNSGNALLMDLKEKSGYLAWYSDAPMALRYGLNMAAPDSKESLLRVIKTLKDERGIYLVAQISCCRDELLGAHSDQVCLRNPYGMYYSDSEGYWLDPYSTIVRDYTEQLVRELWDMGFDEVVLSDVRHPKTEPVENPDGTTTNPVVYTMEMSTDPDSVSAVCGFAVNIAERLQEREKGKFLSIYVDSPPSLVKADPATGQSGPLFMKLYDRVYYRTDKYTYSFNLSDMEPHVTIGEAPNRFVPVVQTYIPDDNPSWVYIDTGE